MSKLKKLVAIVMTVAMVAGLFAFAGPTASAASSDSKLAPIVYGDNDSINSGFMQAIQIFSKMLVIEGYPDGTFKPDGELTRAEAAALIARTLVSRPVADALGTSGSSFSDVQSDHWAAGAVAYAMNRNILVGVGDNRFDPSATLTKGQWIKILLTSIGYGANHEFEGPGWMQRAYETATNTEVDLFGTYDHYWASLPPGHPDIERIKSGYPRPDMVLVPEGGADAAITREEAMALLYNAVVWVEKVVYDRGSDIYSKRSTQGANLQTSQPSSSAGLSGSNTIFIRDDIGLQRVPIQVRDRYGRPVEDSWYTEWEYRASLIYNAPRSTPELIASYKGNQTGTALRTAFNGAIQFLDIFKAVNIFVNYDIAQGAGREPVSAADAGRLASQGFEIYESKNPATGVTEFSADFSAFWILENYLIDRGNNVAFGPSVTIEIYRDGPIGAPVDIVFVVPYLTQLEKKVPDDPRTLLFDETSLQFGVFHYATPSSISTSVSELPQYRPARSMVRGETAGGREVWRQYPVGWELPNYKDLSDNKAEGSYMLTTPYGQITSVGFVPYLDAKYWEDKPIDTELYQLQGVYLNEVYDADK
ncbi:MAG: S-layer homology domain-containing protein, partial [Clostridiales bacterium]|nr:S-layer homology domain-containing protein [Clostridiales bacterium]